AQPAIDALYYLDYSPYHGAKGAVYFSTNGKPVIACRESLWADLEEDSTLIANINAASRDPSSPLGYSMVAVHVWSKNLANVQNVVTNLASDVRVVTPDAFAKLIQQNVGRRLSFDFANGLQGWTTNRTKASDKAQWTSAEGGGALMLDGSDTTPDTTRNSWCIRSIILPPNATTLSFDTRATGDGRLRVRIKDVITPNPPLTVLLDWDTPTTTNWVNRTVSLASYAGQTITFYFDQTDGGPDTNNARFVDNIAILTDGPALYAPATPRLFTPVADLTNGVNLTWRNNDTLAEEFRIERRLASGGVWSEVGSVSGTVTNFSDASMFWGTNYLYRVRGSNASGLGATSNERDVVPPLKPSLTIFNQTNSLTLGWPGWATNYFLYGTTNLTSWTAVSGISTNQNGSNFMTVPRDQSLHFYRLKAQ
ncbi:MAG: choice-of-anchor J domain-containing protein, partial [Verrucomicrobiota bacterium]